MLVKFKDVLPLIETTSLSIRLSEQGTSHIMYKGLISKLTLLDLVQIWDCYVLCVSSEDDNLIIEVSKNRNVNGYNQPFVKAQLTK